MVEAAGKLPTRRQEQQVAAQQSRHFSPVNPPTYQVPLQNRYEAPQVKPVPKEDESAGLQVFPRIRKHSLDEVQHPNSFYKK